MWLRVSLTMRKTFGHTLARADTGLVKNTVNAQAVAKALLISSFLLHVNLRLTPLPVEW